MNSPIFRTILDVPSFANPIDYSSKLIFSGSCFTEHIGSKMQDFQFDSMVNPAGTLFNPFSAISYLHRALKNEQYEQDELIKSDDLWCSMDHHGKHSGLDQKEVLLAINEVQRNVRSRLENSTHIFLSYGTAWVYEHIQTDRIVANCHKIPQQQFKKRLLSINEMIDVADSFIDNLRKVNPEVQFIFTVSPVHHYKNGIENDRLSKSLLRVAIHELCSKNEGRHYFPSYELLEDDLRDYRFYAGNMTHPSEEAIEYIWDRFKSAFISENSYPLMKELDQLKRDVSHRPFNVNSERHQKFKQSVAQKIDQLKREYDFLKLEPYLRVLEE